jgi:hypothetical protein
VFIYTLKLRTYNGILGDGLESSGFKKNWHYAISNFKFSAFGALIFSKNQQFKNIILITKESITDIRVSFGLLL